MLSVHSDIHFMEQAILDSLKGNPGNSEDELAKVLAMSRENF